LTRADTAAGGAGEAGLSRRFRQENGRFMGLVRFALRFPHTFYVLAALILFLGGIAIKTMPADIFPEIRIPVVTVIWQYTGLSTPEMEQRISTYSQYAISSNVNGVKNMEAQTLNGLSVQKIYFQPDVNLDLAIAKLATLTNALLVPAEALIFNREGTRVAVVDDGVARLRKIRVTRDFGTAIEASTGLKSGDKVILNPAAGLADGQKVEIAARGK
jgi:AcrB/AcrD/AcrF family